MGSLLSAKYYGPNSRAKNGHVYGLYSDYETDVNGNYTLTLGVEVNNDDIQANLVVKRFQQLSI